MKCIVLKPINITLFLIAILGFVSVLHVISYIPLIRGTRIAPIYMLNFDAEQNIPALFSTALLWLCAVFAGFISCGERESRFRSLGWGGLALVFFFLGVDESVSLHERLNGFFLRDSGILTLGWVLPYAVLALVFSAVYFRFWLKLPRKQRFLIALAAVLFVLGSLVIEVIGGRMRVDGAGPGYHVMMACEELLEMSGSICFVYAFTSYLDEHIPDFCLSIRS